MQIFFTHFIYQTGVDFKKIPQNLERQFFEVIQNNITTNASFNSKHPEFGLNFIIVIDRQNKEFKVLGPSASHKYETIDFTIWLPYGKIMRTSNYQYFYFFYLQEAIIQVLDKYQISYENLQIAIKQFLMNNHLFDTSNISPQDL